MSESDAEGLLHEVLLAFLTVAVPIRNPRAWLVAAMCNASRAYLRMRSRLDQIDDAALSELVDSITADPDRLHREIQINRVLLLLRPRDREILRLRYFDGLTLAEIGKSLSTSTRYAQRLLTKALLRARSLYHSLSRTDRRVSPSRAESK